jgi:hypothetical protein
MVACIIPFDMSEVRGNNFNHGWMVEIIADSGYLKNNQQKRTARSSYFKTLKEPLILCEFLDIFDIFLG